MTLPIEVQNLEINAQKFKYIEMHLSSEEYAAAKLDSTALIQAIMAALEASDE